MMQWERNVSFLLIGWYFCPVCTSRHRCLHDYAFTCAPAVKSSQDTSGLIEPQRDCVIDGRCDMHWPVSSIPLASTPSSFSSWPLPVQSASLGGIWHLQPCLQPSPPVSCPHIEPVIFSPTLPYSATLDFSSTEIAGPRVPHLHT